MARVLLIGAPGVFGSRIAALLAAPAVRAGPPFIGELVLAARNGAAAAALAQSLAAAPPPGAGTGTGVVVKSVALDAADAGALARTLASVRPHIVINTAGPFQGSDYRVAEAAVAAAAHYVDIADGREYVTRAPAALDAAARAAGVTVLVGASTTPTVTGAAVAAATAGWHAVHTVDVGISPGNQTPRGIATVAAILSYVGKPIPWYDHGAATTVPGWSSLRRRGLAVGGSDADSLPPRWFAAVDVPDASLFPSAFRVRDRVTFRAGLELGWMHLGLWAASLLVRVRAMPSLTPLARPLLAIAGAAKSRGTPHGGMFVDVAGVDADGVPARAEFGMIGRDGDGPYTPALAAVALTRHLAARDGVLPPGAAVALGQIPLAALFREAANLRIAWSLTRTAPVYEAASGAAAYARLPPPIRRLHDVQHTATWVGEAAITPATGLLARIIATVFAMPRTHADAAPLRFDITVARHPVTGRLVETWARRFGVGTPHESRFVSTQEADGDTVVERFGPWAFYMRVLTAPAGLDLLLSRVTFAGIPLPRAAWPHMTANERVVDGRFSFFVRIALPFIGHLVQYTGTLTPHTT